MVFHLFISLANTSQLSSFSDLIYFLHLCGNLNGNQKPIDSCCRDGSILEIYFHRVIDKLVSSAVFWGSTKKSLKCFSFSNKPSTIRFVYVFSSNELIVFIK